MPLQLVVDTSVLVAGLRSKRGAAFQLLSILNDARWQINLSVALVLEYEEVLKRESAALNLNYEDVDAVISALTSISNRRAIPYSWRPMSHDADDDFLIELALNIRADHIITYDLRHLRILKELGFSVITPREFLELVDKL
jgi:putative PIN family toxin of toxin-antitoxin system